MQSGVRRLARPSTRTSCWTLPNAPPTLLHHTRLASQPSTSSPSTSPAADLLSPASPDSPTPYPHVSAVPQVSSAEASAYLPFYSQFPLDRRAELRRDQSSLDELFARSNARLLPLLRDLVLVRPAPTDPTPAAGPLLHPVLLTPASAHANLITTSPARVFLGTDADGAPYFAAAVSSAAAAQSLAAANPGSEWRSARLAGPDLSPGDASLLAVASGLMQWHSSNTFSAATGAPSLPSPGGYSRNCTAGGGSAYPRIDPAVIMLVSYGDWALLGRKAEWPVGRYSTLAGFLDIGEPLEAAVVREVGEEAGVIVDLASVTYSGSQPWPFPRSLMLGFLATATPAKHTTASNNNNNNSNNNSNTLPTTTSSSTTTGPSGSAPATPTTPTTPTSSRHWWQPAPEGSHGFDLLPTQGRRTALDVGLFREEVEAVLGPLQGLQAPVADGLELQDVRWFHKDWLRAVGAAAGGPAPEGPAGLPGAGRFNVPGPYSLANRLIKQWLAGGLKPVAGSVGDGNGGGGGWAGDVVPQVLLSESGTFKYVLMRLWDPVADAGDRSKLLVWGDTRAPYHNDVLQKAKQMARKAGGLMVTPLGGGRMMHDAGARKVQIYGYSAAFGPAPHEVAAALVHKWYPLYDKEAISVSYEGY